MKLYVSKLDMVESCCSAATGRFNHSDNRHDARERSQAAGISEVNVVSLGLRCSINDAVKGFASENVKQWMKWTQNKTS